jgi:TolA-binding protein
MHDYRDSILPYLAHAELMVLGHNYAKANTIYASLEKRKLESEAELEYKLQYAFSLYCAKEYTKSLAKWAELNKNQDVTLSAMTNYFMGECHLKSGNKTKAAGYFQVLIESSDQSKYGYLAKLQLEKLVKK